MNFINKKEVCESLQISGDTFGTWVGLGLPEITPGDFSGNPGVHHPPLVRPGEITGHVNATADQRLKEHQDAKLMGPNGALVNNLTGVNSTLSHCDTI